MYHEMIWASNKLNCIVYVRETTQIVLPLYLQISILDSDYFLQ